MDALEARGDTHQLVSFRVGCGRYGVPIESVIEMTRLGHTDRVAGCGDTVLGLMRLRDQVLPVIDLRRCLELPSLDSEREIYSSRLVEFKAEHLLWVRALEDSVNDGACFALATDSQECKFGQWLHSFETSDERLQFLCERFENPHTRVHAAAERCLAALELGRTKEAQSMLGLSRNDEIADLFEVFNRALQVTRGDARQMAIVLRIGDAVAAAAVDRLESVVSYGSDQLEALDPEAMGPPSRRSLELVSSVVKPREEGRLIQMLDVSNLLVEAEAARD